MRRIALLLTLFAALALCAPGCGALSEGLTLPEGYACQTLFEEDGALLPSGA